MEDRLSLDILAGGSVAEVNEVRLNKVMGSHDGCSAYFARSIGGIIINRYRMVLEKAKKASVVKVQK